MAVINKANVTPPSVPKEVVDVPELGGEVIVRGLMLSDRVRILTASFKSESRLSALLASTVVDEKNEPIFTEQEWEEFGSRHFAKALELFKKAKELSGLDAEINEKKS